MAHINIVASMMFAGVTGSAVADAAALGPMEIEMMTEQDMTRSMLPFLTCASVASIGTHHSTKLASDYVRWGGVWDKRRRIAYGGIGSGILMGINYHVGGMLVCQHDFPTSEVYSVKEIIKALPEGIGALPSPIVVLKMDFW